MLGSIFAVAIPAAAAQADMVTVCHKPGTPAEQDLVISQNALGAHLAHGDFEGVCVPPVTPTPTPPPVACSQLVSSGGQGETFTDTELGMTGPTSFQLYYEMYNIPDQLQVIYEGVVIFDTVGLVSGGTTTTVTVPAGSATTVTVRLYAPNSGTAWDYIVYCP